MFVFIAFKKTFETNDHFLKQSIKVMPSDVFSSSYLTTLNNRRKKQWSKYLKCVTKVYI